MSELGNQSVFKETGLYDTRSEQRVAEVENTRMRKGQRLVISGFGVAIVGIVLYCMAAFSAGFGQEEPVFIKESLIIVGFGTLIWLIGAIQYLNGAIDGESSEDDLL